MSDEGKVVSLTDRLRAKTAKSGPIKTAPVSSPAEPGDAKPVPSKLAWLFCPTCKTLEYTEMLVAGGRRHNVCGSTVHEAVVDVDARAEYTLAELNLRRLAALEELLDAQRQRFLEYQDRLRKAAGRNLASYPMTEVAVQSLPVAELDALGLLISKFLHQPAARFPEAQTAKPSAGEDPSGG